MTQKASTAKAIDHKSNTTSSTAIKAALKSQSHLSPQKRLLQLHRQYGNKAIQRMHETGVLQAKLKISLPNDKYEQEADRVAERVVSMPEPEYTGSEEEREDLVKTKPLADHITPLVQRQIEPEEEEEKEENLQTKPLADQITPLVQRQMEPEEEEPVQAKMLQPQAEEEEEVQKQTEEEIVQAKPFIQGQSEKEEDALLQGKFTNSESLAQFQSDGYEAENSIGMPDQLKKGLEKLSGMDLSGARVHGNSSKPAQINALAYTQGQDIHVSPGQERHLAHEGWNVVQQLKGRVEPMMQAKNVSINNKELEREVDVMGTKALHMNRAEPAPTGSGQQIQMKANCQRDTHAVDPINDRGAQVSSSHVSSTSTIQRNNDEESNLARLNEMLNSIDVPEDGVITLCEELTAAEKTIVLEGGYKSRMVASLNFSEMVRAVNNLGPALSIKLKWANDAAFTTNSIDYDEIDDMVKLAPQTERDALKTDNWKSFFVNVCTNETMVEALNDLKFDLETKLNWLKAEMTVTNWELEYSDIKDMILAAPQAERDVLKTLQWRLFFIDVCTDETIVEAVDDLGFEPITRFFWILQEAFPILTINFKELADHIIEQLDLPEAFKDESVKIINCMISKDISLMLIECKSLDKRCLLESLPWKKCLLEFAERNCPENMEKLSEEKKQELFKSDVNCTISILLQEFVTGKGPEKRRFLMSEAITQAHKEGRAVKQAIEDFYKKNKGRTIDNLKPTYYEYKFSPTGDLDTLFNIPQSLIEHMEAIREVGEKGTWSTFYTGGVDLIVIPFDNVLYIYMLNLAGKESLMLHAVPDLARDPNKLTELGTTYQLFIIEVPLDINKLKK